MIAAPAVARQVGVVRRFVAVHVSRWGLTEHDRDCVVLIVGELAGNAARHGGGVMTVSVSLDDRDVSIEVVDRGPSQRDAHAPIVDEQERGRGLGIVEHLACSTEFSAEPDGWRSRAGLRVALEVDAPAQIPADAPAGVPTDAPSPRPRA